MFVWKRDYISSIIFFFFGLVPSIPVCFFFYALVGGWEAAGLDEVAEASRLTGFIYQVVRVVFVIPSRWGAKLSPMHNRFPIAMRESAMAEARALTEARVKLVEA